MPTSPRTRGRRLAAAGTLVLVAALLFGPRTRVRTDQAPEPAVPTAGLDAWLAAGEDTVPALRAGDQKQIVWAGAPDSVTDIGVVYLHGFSADRHEIDPVPLRVAAALGANLFYTRLAGHGRDGAAMGEAAADDWLRDSEQAMAVARRMGRRVVLMGTSTGGTLATWAAAQERWGEDLAAVVLVSPNFALRDTRTRMLLWPWGGALARAVEGPEHCFTPASEDEARHWTPCYPTRALLAMMALVDHVRRIDPARVHAPTLVLYSPNDAIVDPSETERLFAGFASETKRMVPVDGDPDGEHHVLAGDIVSPGTTDLVVGTTLDFLALAGVRSAADTLR